MKRIILAAALVLGGCSDMPLVPTEVKHPTEVIEANKASVVDYLDFNFAGTEWLKTVKGTGITQLKDGTVVLGVETHQREDYLSCHMAFITWARNDATIRIDELRFYHNDEVVLRTEVN